MAKVTGFLNDFQLGHLSDRHPTIVFEPSGVAVGGATVFAPEQATVVPVGATGYFEADLQPTDILRPAVHYNVVLQWGSGRRVILPWALKVPNAGGALTNLVPAPASPDSVWISTNPPTNPSPGTWWLNPITGDLQEWTE